jgi:ABC-type glutathione transport system ATPase component
MPASSSEAVGHVPASSSEAVGHISGASVSLRGVSKRFGATRALVDVDLDVRAGTIHALVGENGAGKSTLGKIVGGIYGCDASRSCRWCPR